VMRLPSPLKSSLYLPSTPFLATFYALLVLRYATPLSVRLRRLLRRRQWSRVSSGACRILNVARSLHPDLVRQVTSPLSALFSSSPRYLHSLTLTMLLFVGETWTSWRSIFSSSRCVSSTHRERITKELVYGGYPALRDGGISCCLTWQPVVSPRHFLFGRISLGWG
jgi:hypothetical protein